MRAVKAIYENGNLSLREPVKLKGRHEVTVLVPEDDPDPEEILQYAGMLRDLTPEQRRLYDEALSRNTRPTRSVRKVREMLRQNWAGGIRAYRDQYSALELQEKALEWRGD